MGIKEVIIVNMDCSYGNLSEISQLLITLAKENRNLTNFIKEAREFSSQERELIRESLKINIQLASQLQEQLANLQHFSEGDNKLKKLEYGFQIECAVLESLAEQILAGEKQYCKQTQCSEQAPLLAETGSWGAKEEQKDLESVSIQGRANCSSVLMQEATASLRHINRICAELEFVVMSQSLDHQEDWKVDDVKGKQGKKKERTSKLKILIISALVLLLLIFSWLIRCHIKATNPPH
eukprot:TRINITY_DN3426_c0_g2_i9.p1 TRINITY_DN3426_c0_g2~~TRINITY_DN3426_c0_g2_i9.p1  ORF type:complete len:238 (+),score=51.86 TRINITY_DN3426_c0_g2_i9:107-820(+)